MKCLVTGVAGFIGSHLAERLVKDGYNVTGIDCFTRYYSRKIKEKNIKNLLRRNNFKFIKGNLIEMNLDKVIKGVNYVFHQAAQAGIRGSWGNNFKIYTNYDVLATQKLLEATIKEPRIKKFLYASSSSIYGDVEEYPVKETALPKPLSPYGVAKLAGEHLTYLYWKNHGIPIISLRYFTVYGPRQRPDMAFYKIIKANMLNKTFPIYGSGEQKRDFTYIDDIINANILAMNSKYVNQIFNIGGGTNITLNVAIKIIEGVLNKKTKVRIYSKQKGDVKQTLADISKAKRLLRYIPIVKIDDGLEKEIAWFWDNKDKLLINT